MNIVNVGYDSTNYYAIDLKSGKLLVDCGWPGTLPKLSAELKRKGIGLAEINYLLVTHFHPDHAGLTQELKQLGAKHILLESQPASIAPLTSLLKTKNFPYIEILEQDSLKVKFGESRAFLARLGVSGEIISTPGHSPDSVTLILDEGAAFTGDLYPLFMVSEEDQATRESWDKIYEHHIKRIFPGHGT